MNTTKKSRGDERLDGNHEQQPTTLCAGRSVQPVCPSCNKELGNMAPRERTREKTEKCIGRNGAKYVLCYLERKEASNMHNKQTEDVSMEIMKKWIWEDPFIH